MMLSCLATAGTPEDIDSKLSECVEDKQGEYKREHCSSRLSGA